MIDDLWPQVNETTLRDRGEVFSDAATKLTAVIDGWERERHMMFNGHIWSESAAESADTALQELLKKLQNAQGR